MSTDGGYVGELDTVASRPMPQLDLPSIVFLGGPGSGKSMAAKILTDGWAYETRSLSRPLYDVAVRLWGVQAKTNRFQLQSLGEAIQRINPGTLADLFVERLARNPYDRIVVDGARYPADVWKLAEAGFIFVRVIADRNVRLSRLQAIGRIEDESQLDLPIEHALDGYKTQYTITNNTNYEDELRDQIVNILNRERS